MELKHQLAFFKALAFGQNAEASLRSRAAHSGAWIGVSFALQKAMQLGSNLILTRLLFPTAFGLMALATLFLVGLQMFSDIGLKPAVIRDSRGDDPVFLNTAWTIQVVRGFILCLTGTAIAYPISLVYQQPILFPLLAVLSTTAAVMGFMSISMATAERRLNFRAIAMVQLFGQAASIVLLVTLAYFWRSVWALAVANVVGAVLNVAIGYMLLPRHCHKLKMDHESAKSLIHFGRWILFSTLATYLGGEGLKAIQGHLLTPAEFGVLAIAYTIAGIPNDLAQKLSGSIGLPVLAETYRQAPEQARVVLHGFRIRTLAISFFFCSAIVFTANTFIHLMYDSRYYLAVGYIIALSLTNYIAALGQGYTSALLATGRTAYYFSLTSATSLLRILATIIGFKNYGIFGIFYGIGAANIIAMVLIVIVAGKLKFLDLKTDICFSFLLCALIAIKLVIF